MDILKRFLKEYEKEDGKMPGDDIIDMRVLDGLLPNEEITPEEVLLPARKEALKQMRKRDVVLIIQDQTSMNYGKSRLIQEIYDIKKPGNEWMQVHGLLAIAEDKTPIGLVGGYVWKRRRRSRDKRRQTKRMRTSITSGKNKYWLQGYRDALELARSLPETTPVMVGNRNMDIHPLWQLWQRCPEPKPHILVQVNQSLSRKTISGELLSEVLHDTPWEGKVTLEIQRNRKDVSVRPDLRYKKIELAPHGPTSIKKVKRHKPLVCWLVEVKENHPPTHVKKPLHWFLLTTFPVENLNDAQRVATWYTRRRMIDAYFRVLKTACREDIRDFRLDHRPRIALALDMIIAWRIFHMTFFGRNNPHLPCTVSFSEAEWRVIYHLKQRPIPPQPPTVGELLIDLASLGGFFPHKTNQPGFLTLWRGFLYALPAIKLYTLLHPLESEPYF